MEFSLFFFADGGDAAGGRCYDLLLDSARFADTHGLRAVWTPERHFHRFGGQYPNPSVTGAAVAAVTERVGVRAGSVVAPLHHPLRIAEEWAVVDNLSDGRVGLSFASGWHASDFVLRPDDYVARKAVTADVIDTVRRLWRGEAVEYRDGAGQSQPTRVFPRPVQPELPVWLTSAGNPETFRVAGRLGANVLTHLLGQGIDGLTENIAAYRDAYAEAHGTRARGEVALMLHTFLGVDRDEVRETVRAPLSGYLRSSMDLVARSSGLLPAGVDPNQLPQRDKDYLVDAAFERYFTTSGLFGTVEDGRAMVDRLAGAGVDEVACLIDYGVADAQVLASLPCLARLADTCANAVP